MVQKHKKMDKNRVVKSIFGRGIGNWYKKAG